MKHGTNNISGNISGLQFIAEQHSWTLEHTKTILSDFAEYTPHSRDVWHSSPGRQNSSMYEGPILYGESWSAMYSMKLKKMNQNTVGVFRKIVV